MRQSLAELFVKGAFGMGSPSSLVTSRNAHSVRALEDIDPSLLNAALNKVIRTREEGVGLRTASPLMIGGMGGLTPVWDAVPKPQFRASFRESERRHGPSLPRPVRCASPRRCLTLLAPLLRGLAAQPCRYRSSGRTTPLGNPPRQGPARPH